MGTSLGVIHDIHDLAYGGGLIPPLVDSPRRMRILGSKYSLALWAEVGVPGWEFAGSSGVVALGTTVSGVERAKKEKNEPQRLSWFIVGTYFVGLPPPPRLSLVHPTCSPCPNPSSSSNEPPTSIWKGEGRRGWDCASRSPECW